LPDLEFKYEQWGVPLSRPYALGEANTLMFGLRQSFPAPGTLDAAADAALEEAKASLASEAARVEDIRSRVRRAFFEYFRTEQEYRIHLEHVELASAIVELARSNYQAGRGTQPDVLRVVVELSRLHTDVAAIEQERKSSRAMLNTLMARPPDARLGPAEDVKAMDVRVRLEEADRTLQEHRPELAVAEHEVRRSQAVLEGAKSAGRWPALMVGADYWYMPTLPSPHAYGAMVSISLPWLNPRHGDEVREAEHTLAADARALESVRNVVRFELRDAAARLEAARSSYTILERDLLPQAQQSFEAARAGYATGKSDALSVLDAMRSYLQIRLEEVRALARMGQSAADLERAIGTELPPVAEDTTHEPR
jgi:outer membrane protein TolC